MSGAVTRVLVTGGMGFIGSNLVRHLRAVRPEWEICNVDLLALGSNPANLADLEGDAGHRFVRADIADAAAMHALFAEEDFQLVLHLAAESHVDRSIESAAPFVRTNVLGTQVLLDQCRHHGVGRLVVVSTDEVYGELGPDDPPFTEDSPITPSSPYSASKAGGDHLALACHRTHGLDVVVTRCSNNYGAYQFTEKLIPRMVTRALQGESLPVYGDGRNVRDWIHVEDHCRGVVAAAERGVAGRVYNLGGGAERSNLEVVREIVRLTGADHDLITFVEDRPGHDFRYAIDATRASVELGWRPERTFEEGLRTTVDWYRENPAWWQAEAVAGTPAR
jgi:dTDP-glucose 4,6-dehydratase